MRLAVTCVKALRAVPVDSSREPTISMCQYLRHLARIYRFWLRDIALGRVKRISLSRLDGLVKGPGPAPKDQNTRARSFQTGVQTTLIAPRAMSSLVETCTGDRH